MPKIRPYDTGTSCALAGSGSAILLDPDPNPGVRPQPGAGGGDNFQYAEPLVQSQHVGVMAREDPTCVAALCLACCGSSACP